MSLAFLLYRNTAASSRLELLAISLSLRSSYMMIFTIFSNDQIKKQDTD